MAVNKKNLNEVFAKNFVKASFFLIILFSQSIFCFSDQNNNEVESISLDSRLSISGNYTYLDLTPEDNPGFHGNLGGIQALYEYRPLNRFYGGLKFEWKEGDTHGLAGKRSILYFDVQERLGYTVGSEKNGWLLALFSGFGYHYIGQKLTTTDGAFIHFGYNEFYFPVGLLANYDINSWFSLGLDFTWMPEIFPTVSIVPLKGANWTLTNVLSNFSVKLPFTFSLTKNKHFLLICTPFYELWKDGHTTAELSTGAKLGLPGNTYNFYGFDLNFSYCF